MNDERLLAYRKLASTLLEQVLNEDISARTALNSWPSYGNVDPSVRCAYTMLWFFEADEDRHKEEAYYADVQVKRLTEATQLLSEGKPLPPQVLHQYKDWQAPPEYESRQVLMAPLTRLGHWVAQLATLIRSHPFFSKR